MKICVRIFVFIILVSALFITPSMVFGQTRGSPAIIQAEADSISMLVTINGSNFGTTRGTVTLGNSTLAVDAWTPSRIIAQLPSTVASGSHPLTVTVPSKGNPAIVTLAVTGGSGSPFPVIRRNLQLFR